MHRARSYLRAAVGCAALSAAAATARGGWIEDRPDGTVIHVALYALPEAGHIDPAQRANAAAVREFVRRFPRLFAERHRAKALARPDLYGRHDWDRVRVELHRFSGIEVEGVEGTLLAIAGGVAPDVLYVNFRQSESYIRQGLLHPLDRPEDGYLAAVPRAEFEERVHPKIRPVIRRAGPDGAGRTWALPFGGALGKVVWYRRDVFDEAGVPYPANDWTWEDFRETCRRLSDPARSVYGVLMPRGKHEAWYWLTFLWSAGGEVLAPAGSGGPLRAAFASDAGVDSLDYYTRLCTEPWSDAQGRRRYGYALKESAGAGRKWERGEIGMMFGYIDGQVFATMNPDVTGIAPVPRGPGGGRAAELNSAMMGLFAGIREPAVRDAAWEYMRFYDGEDALRIKTKVLVEAGLGRFIHPDQLRRFGHGGLAALVPREWEECFRIAMETGRPEPYEKDSTYVYNLLSEPIAKAEDLAVRGRLPEDPAARRAVLGDLLREAARKVDEQMLGELPPARRAARTATAALLLAAMAAAFAFALRNVARSFRAPDASAGDGGGEPGGRRGRRAAWLLLLPALATIVIWAYVPLVRGSAMAFQDVRLLGDSAWVGLANIGDALWDAAWWRALWNSARYSLLVVALTFLPPVALAILLQEIPRGRLLFRTLFYLPAVMSGLVVLLLWKSFFAPSESGALNAVLLRLPAWALLAAGAAPAWVAAVFGRRLWLHRRRGAAALAFAAAAALLYTGWALAHPALAQEGLAWWRRPFATLPEPFRWLLSSETALLCCVLPLAWAGMGPGCLIYLAALKGIPDDFYEAADIDGATFADKILFIVLPMLRPLLVINFIGVFIHSWQAEANILAMTAGASGTEVAGLHIFYKAFIFLKFGPATAMAWMLAFLLIGFTAHQLRMLSRLEFRTTGEKQ